MYVLYWVLFTKHRSIKWYYPLATTLFPVLYCVFAFVRVAILKGFNISSRTLYPYFFLNVEEQGILGVAKWILMLMAAFIAVGYVFYGIDKLIKSKE